jgi:polyphosphate kinase 2 (PPK2 family)
MAERAIAASAPAGRGPQDRAAARAVEAPPNSLAPSWEMAKPAARAGGGGCVWRRSEAPAGGFATLRRRKRALSLDRTTKPQRFRVARRPRLAEIVEHPKMDFADYERRLTSLQGVLQLIQQAYLGTSERAIIVLEGWDTAGKGGVVRRLGWALDPRSFKVNPIASPDEHERAQHYLQRFWRRLPEKGQIVAFDRSWYGRVLVERVEGFATEKEWRRAYREINEFERVLVDSGVRLVKLFLHITPEEQMRRFRNRLIDPVKRWKLSYEDFRNRSHWAEYETAIEDMMAETSTKHAPWHLIPANNKPFGRIAAFRILAGRLGKDVSLEPRPIDPDLMKEAKRALGLSAADIARAADPAARKARADDR